MSWPTSHETTTPSLDADIPQFTPIWYILGRFGGLASYWKVLPTSKIGCHKRTICCNWIFPPKNICHQINAHCMDNEYDGTIQCHSQWRNNSLMLNMHYQSGVDYSAPEPKVSEIQWTCMSPCLVKVDKIFTRQGDVWRKRLQPWNDITLCRRIGIEWMIPHQLFVDRIPPPKRTGKDLYDLEHDVQSFREILWCSPKFLI